MTRLFVQNYVTLCTNRARDICICTQTSFSHIKSILEFENGPNILKQKSEAARKRKRELSKV